MSSKSSLSLSTFLLSASLLFGGCAAIQKVGPGDAAIHGQMVAQLDGAWNKVNRPGVPSGQSLWTRDGVTLDTLRAWSGLREGDLLAPDLKDQRSLVFRADMPPDQVVALLEGYYARGGNIVTVDKVEPASFLAGPGTRLDFSVVTKGDNVKRSGLAFFSVRAGELHALVFTAPRLVFFPKYRADVERLAQTARLR